MIATWKLASKIRMGLLVTTALVIPCAAQASTYTWSYGGVSNTWQYIPNWSCSPSCSGAPANGNAVIIGSGTLATEPLLNSAATLNSSGSSLTINSGATLTIGSSGTLTMGSQAINDSGSILVTGTGRLVSGAVTVNSGGSMAFSGTGASSGTYTLNNGSSIAVSNGTVGGTYTLNNGSSIAVSGGTANGAYTLNNGSSITITGGALSGTGSAVTLNGGTITNSGPLPSAGGILVSGGTFSPSTISGFGTVNGPALAATASPIWNANGPSGSPLTLTSGHTYSGTFTTASGQGGFIWDNVTVQAPSTSGGNLTNGTGGVYNLNGTTMIGATNGLFNVATLSGSGTFNVLGDSTLKGNISANAGNTFWIGGANGAHTLSLVPTSANATFLNGEVFNIGTGGTVNYNSSYTASAAVTITMAGGTLTTDSASGVFKVGGPISGYGTVSGNVDITGNVTASVSGTTLTLNGGTGASMQLGNSSGSGTNLFASSGATLDLTGNISIIEPALWNPNGGTIKFDGVHLSNGFSVNPVSTQSGFTTSGTYDVVNTGSTLNNVAFSTGNGANLVIDAPLTVSGGGSINATNVTVDSTGSLNLTNTTGSTALTTKNLTLANGSTLVVGATNNAISLTGNFINQSTITSSWTYGDPIGLGPDLIMTGGTTLVPTTLEVGGVNKGYVPTGFTNNFALNSLTIGANTVVDLVDQYANATPTGWTSGVEALYLDGLFGTSKTVAAILNLDGLFAYLEGYGVLKNGIYTDSNGDLVAIFGANAAAETPLPGTLPLFASGLGALGLLGWRRKRKNAAIAA